MEGRKDLVRTRKAQWFPIFQLLGNARGARWGRRVRSWWLQRCLGEEDLPIPRAPREQTFPCAPILGDALCFPLLCRSPIKLQKRKYEGQGGARYSFVAKGPMPLAVSRRGRAVGRDAAPHRIAPNLCPCPAAALPTDLQHRQPSTSFCRTARSPPAHPQGPSR